MQKLNINEIFASINGEVNRWGQGSPTVFVRLQGCNLDCPYPCDTKYAQEQIDNKLMTIPDILTRIQSFGIKRVTITGGEPLLQENVFSLIGKLALAGYQISVETNGSIKIPEPLINNHICWIVDYKMDFQDQMIQNNYLNLAETDYIKFVIDNSWKLARAVLIKQHLQNEGCKALFAFSPVGANPELAGEMAQWLIEFKIDDVLLNIQIHKIINVK